MKNSLFRSMNPPPRAFLKVVAMLLISSGLVLRSTAQEMPPLTDVKGNPRLPGKFIWADLVTDDVTKAMAFYAQLFGWRFLPVGNYYLAMNQSRPIGGVFQKERPAANPNARPRWFGYISVPSVKKVESLVTSLGGRTIAPRQNFPKRGEQAVFADPEGAIFGVMRSSGGDPEDFVADPGEWMWIQLLSRDARKASDFYKAIAGYEVVENTENNRLNDYVLTSEGFARATVRSMGAMRSDVNPTWLPYVRVEDVSNTVLKAKQLGGTVLVEPRPDLLEGKAAVIADPTGAPLGVLAWVPGEKKGAQ